MAHLSLTRSEAEARSAQLSVDSMIIELDLTDPGSRDLRLAHGDHLRQQRRQQPFVEFRGRELTSARLNGVDLDPSVLAARADRASAACGPENTLIIEGQMGYSDDGEGLHRHVDPQAAATCTRCPS